MADIATTQALVEKARNGDTEALSELYNRYVARVLTAVRVRLGGELRKKVESWDVVQDAMMAGLRDIQSFEHESEGAFLRWLNRIVENRTRDHIDYARAAKRDHRREKRLAKASSESSPSPLELAGGVPRPSQILALRDDLSRLEAALEQLPDDIRDLLIATKLEGRTYAEIAQAEDSSPDAIRMKANRAMVALTKAFKELEAKDG